MVQIRINCSTEQTRSLAPVTVAPPPTKPEESKGSKAKVSIIGIGSQLPVIVLPLLRVREA